MKNEIIKVLEDKKTKTIFLIVLGIMLFDVVMAFLASVYGILLINGGLIGADITSDEVMHPAFAAFLSGNSSGHIAQMLFVWLMPMLLLWLVSDSYIREKKQGYNSLEKIRTSRVRLYTNKMVASFVVSFSIVLIGLMFNFLLCNIVFIGGGFFSELDIAYGVEGIDKLQFDYPNITYLLYMLLCSLMAGVLGVICNAICLIFPKYFIAYPICFVLWTFLWITEVNLGSLVQPFTAELEYRMDNTYLAISILAVSFIVSIIISGVYKVRFDEY